MNPESIKYGRNHSSIPFKHISPLLERFVISIDVDFLSIEVCFRGLLHRSSQEIY